MADKHWADIAESTSTLGIRFLLAAYSFGGRLLFLPLLTPVIFFFFLLNKDARKAIDQYLTYLHQFNRAMPAPALVHCFRVFWSFGLAILDKFSVWQGSIQREDVTIHNYHFVEELRDSSRGGIILISHLGNFEICHALSNSSQGINLTVLVHTKHAQQFNAMLESVSGDSKVEILQVSEVDSAMAMVLAEKVNRGEFVAIAGDRVPVNSGHVLQHDFLSQVANFPKGPFVLSTVLAKPVLMLNCLNQNGRYHIYFDQLWSGGHVPKRERDQFIESLAAAYVKKLQYYVVKAPYQWFNFFNFWHQASERK